MRQEEEEEEEKEEKGKMGRERRGELRRKGGIRGGRGEGGGERCGRNY